MPVRPAPWCLAALFLAVTGAARAEPVRYALDPVHTRVVFAVSHAGFSQAIGTVSGSTGELDFDPADWTRTRLDVQVPLARLDLGDTKWNRATLAANLLDAARHPHARFVSEHVEALAENSGRACGQLTLRGQTRPLCMDVTLNALKRHPMPPFRQTAGFSATARLSRSDFGITAWPSMIGDEVELRIEAEAVRGRVRAPTEPAVAPTADVPEPDEAP